MKLIILTDYLGAFYSSTKNTKTLCTMNTDKIYNLFLEMGYEVEIITFSKVDYNKDYSNNYVLYTSSEDYGLKYKSFIEDIIIFLKEKNAIIIPDYIYLRAHHNKSFMELLRYKIFPESSRMLNTKIYGVYEELDIDSFEEKKYVIKSAYGAGSKDVKLAMNKKELAKNSKKISSGNNFIDSIKEIYKRIFWKGYANHSINRNKFIIQNYISGLKGDYKILKYGERFYTLYRENRANDFRASGSGLLNFDLPQDIDVDKLLDFARYVSEKIGTPLCSMDIAFNGDEFILIEFQILHFGPYTAEYSEKYYSWVNNEWIETYEICDLEKIFCEAIDNHIQTIEGR